MRPGRQSPADDFGRIYDAYAKRVYAYVRSRWSQRAGAEVDDIFQEVWLRFGEKGMALASEEHVLPWLFRVAHNLVEDLRKKMRPQPLADGMDAIAIGTSADAELTRKDEAQRLADCLRQLETHQPQTGALARALLAGEDYGQIRQRLALAANRASELKAAAVKLLRDCVNTA
jgi:RNA polymerase sigma factor (sigma-70 family)